MEHPREILKRRGLHAAKQRGQNFLIHFPTAQGIAAATGAGPDDVVVEIGPGLGALTLALAERAGRVIALEVDRGVFSALEEALAQAGAANVEPRLQDALKADWEALAGEAGRPLVVVGNLPYNISSPLIFALLAARGAWRSATLMLQDELVGRMASHPGTRDWGRLSVMTQALATVEPGPRLGPEQFFPRPGVDSRVVTLTPRRGVDLGGPSGEARLSAVVKAAFGQRRKTLLNSLAAGLGLAREAVAPALAAAGIDPRRRAETLEVAEFLALAQELTPDSP